MFRAVMLVVALALLVMGPDGGPARAEENAAAPALPVAFGGPFTLVDHRGRTRSDSDFRGQFMLIYFGYTYCPDICPTNLQIMTEALDELGDKAEQVQPIFISVDPARDTVDVLKDYVTYFHPRLVGLTGSEAQVRAVAKAYRVHRSKVVMADAPAEDYLVNHSSITFLMGPAGEFVTLFPHDTQADAMAAAIKKYVN